MNTATNRKLDIQAALETIQIIHDALRSSDYIEVLKDNKYGTININIANAKNFIERIQRSKLNGKNEETYKRTLATAKQIYTQLLNDKKELDNAIGNIASELKTVSGPLGGLFGNSKINANEALFGGRRRRRTQKARKARKTRRSRK
jgi:hypothetical protein